MNYKIGGYFDKQKTGEAAKKTAKTVIGNAGLFYADMAGYKIKHKKKHHHKKKHERHEEHRGQPIIIMGGDYGSRPSVIYSRGSSYKHHTRKKHKKTVKQEPSFFSSNF